MSEQFDEISKKWYTFLYRQSDRLNPGLQYGSVTGRTMKLSDVFIKQNVVHSAVYGIGRTFPVSQSGQSNAPKYSVDQLLCSSSNNRHLLIGELGVGKTCLLNHICYVISDYRLNGTQSDSLFVKSYRDKFVIFLSMGALKRSVAQIFDFDLYSWITNSITKVCGGELGEWFSHNMAKFLSNGILLLVDGIDEIDADNRKFLLQKLNAYTENPDNIVISSIRKEVVSVGCRVGLTRKIPGSK